MSDKSNPLVSIGLPVYNGENYIEQALNSILAQTYPNIEIIICDNASTDKTEEICGAYTAKDQRIRYYNNHVNLGAAKNYNRVFQLSTGKYFKWAAHDDLLAPEFIEKCVHILEENPGTVLCYPGTELIDEHGEPEGKYIDGLHLRSPHSHHRFRKFFHTQGLCHAVFGLIRSDILMQTNLIGNYPMSDRVLLGELSLYGQFFELDEYLFIRRIHPKISTHANVTDNEVAAWFDPSKRRKPIFPRWRRFFEYIRAIKRAPLSITQKFNCYLQLGYFSLIPGRWGGMLQDLFKATKIALLSLFIRKSRSTDIAE